MHLGDVVESLQYGFTAKAVADNGGTKFARISDIKQGLIDWPAVPGCEIGSGEYDRFALADGDLLFARTGSIEKACRVRQPPRAVFASYLIRGRPLEPRLGAWLEKYVSSFEYVAQAKSGSVGIGRANLNAQTLAKIELPLPPIGEQQRLVAALDEHLSRVDAATATLDRVRRSLERYRASVLKAAVEGHLVPCPEFDRPKWRALKTIVATLDQGWSPHCDREAPVAPDEWGVIKTTAIQPMSFDGRESKRLPATLNPRPRLEVVPGDVLITRAGPRSRAAVSCMVRLTRRRLMICDKVYRIRVDERLARPAYLELVLNSAPVVAELERLKTGISDSGVNLTQAKFMQLGIPVPSLRVQLQVEQAVEAALQSVEVVASSCAAEVRRLARLRQSILKWAFEGKLVDQDPNDEPAAVLLERIKAERAAAAPVTKSRVKRPRAKVTR